MGALVQEQIDISCVPVQSAEHQVFIITEHLKKFFVGKTERLHIGDCRGSDRVLDLESGPMTSGKDCAAAVEGADLAGTVFMLQSGDDGSGYDVVDVGHEFSTVPESVVL